MNFSPGGECKPSPGLPMASLCWTAQISQAVETPAGRFVFLGSGKRKDGNLVDLSADGWLRSQEIKRPQIDPQGTSSRVSTGEHTLPVVGT